MPNPSTWTEISSKGKQAAGYANTQVNNVSFNCMNWNLYHGQIWLSVSYFDGQWSEGIMPRVAFYSSKAVESTGPACFKPVLLPWIQIFFVPQGTFGNDWRCLFLSQLDTMERVLLLEYGGPTRDAPKHSATHRNPLFSAQQVIIWRKMSTVVRFRNIEFDGWM